MLYIAKYILPKYINSDELTKNSIIAFNLSENEGDLLSALRPFILCYNKWRPSYLSLNQQNIATINTLEDLAKLPNKPKAAILQISKHKTENKFLILEAAKYLSANSPLIIYGAKNLGINSIKKWVENSLPITAQYSKNHNIYLIFKNKPENLANTILSDYVCDIDGKFQTKAGFFSHGKIDEGSSLLSSNFDKICWQGVHNIADFGAGWGYLSYQLIQYLNNNQTTLNKAISVDLLEADLEALKAGRQHINQLNSKFQTGYHWLDIISEAIPNRYNLIICNPPFHSAKQSDVELGRNFIIKASQALYPGGSLVLVANKHLAYEKTIKQYYKSSCILSENNKFKLILAKS